MLRINGISSDAKQKHTLLLDDGSNLIINMEYKPLQTGWFIVQLVHNTFVLNNLRIVTSPNMLHQYKNQIPFGLGCFVQGDQEPMLKEDFSSNRAKLRILTAAEVILYGEILSGQTTA